MPKAEYRQMIVVTDLDGTLLDHDSYDYSVALPALNRLESRGIPVIFASSKTRSEMVRLKREMANQWPFVIENGAAICALEGPDNEDVVLGTPYAEIRRFLAEMRAKGFDFSGFGDMDRAEVAACTGLSLQAAALAREREYSEPLVLRDSDGGEQAFVDEVRRAGLRAQQGGRFLTVSGDTDKGRALAWLRNYYKDRDGIDIEVIALGDSPNDEAMLNAADTAVIVRSGKSSAISVTGAERVIHTQERGPAGWCSAILNILEGRT